jgi:hypothetical protein
VSKRLISFSYLTDMCYDEAFRSVFATSPLACLTSIKSRVTKLTKTQLANRMVLLRPVFPTAQDGTPGTERPTRNRRVGCACGRCDLFCIAYLGSYEVSRSHIYANGIPAHGLTSLKVDLARVNSTDLNQSWQPESPLRDHWLQHEHSVSSILILTRHSNRTKSPSYSSPRFTAIPDPHFHLAAPDFTTAFPTFARTYFCGSGYPILGHAPRAWPIRYAYGLYDDCLCGCNLIQFVFYWTNASRVPEDLQYCASIPVSTVSVTAATDIEEKSLGRKT